MKGLIQEVDRIRVILKDAQKLLQQTTVGKHIYEHIREKNLTNVQKAIVRKVLKHLEICKNIFAHILVNTIYTKHCCYLLNILKLFTTQFNVI